MELMKVKDISAVKFVESLGEEEAKGIVYKLIVESDSEFGEFEQRISPLLTEWEEARAASEKSLLMATLMNGVDSMSIDELREFVGAKFEIMDVNDLGNESEAELETIDENGSEISEIEEANTAKTDGIIIEENNDKTELSDESDEEDLEPVITKPVPQKIKVKNQ